MSASIRRDVVILACASSAGIHGALVPEHLGESAAAGAGFAVATVLLASLAIAATRSRSELPLAAAAVTFLGLIAAYALAATTGLPLLHAEPESLDALGLLTKGIEAAGLLAASTLLRPRPAVARIHPYTKGA